MRLTKKYYGNTSASIKAINYCKKCSRKCPSTNKGFVKWYLHTSHSHMQTFSIYQSMEDVEVQSWICKWMTFHLGRNKLRHLGTSKAKQSQCRRVKRQNRKAKIPRVTPRRPRGSERKAAGWFALLRSGSLGCRLLSTGPRLLALCHSLQLRSSAAASRMLFLFPSGAGTCTSRGWDPLLSDWRNSSSFLLIPVLFVEKIGICAPFCRNWSSRRGNLRAQKS